MTVIYIDGSVLTCSKIEVNDGYILCDDYRIVDNDDIDHIED